MQNTIILGLIQNTAILLSFSMLYDYVWAKNEKSQTYKSKILLGIIIGFISLFLMSMPWILGPGIAFDTRSILLAISGLFFGPIPTFTAMAISILFRIYMGGDGLYMGVAVIVSSGILGILWRKYRPTWMFSKTPAYELLTLGFIVHVTMLACTFLLPANRFLETISTIALPLLIIYSPATMLLGMLMIKQKNNWENRKAKDMLLESERWFTELLKNMNLLTVIIDRHGHLTFANNYFINNTGYSYLEIIGNNWYQQFITPRDRQEMEQIIGRFVNGADEFSNHENEIIIKDGSKLLVSWNNTALRDKLGNVIGIASIGEIITEQKLIERKKLQFATILEASLNEIYLISAKSLYFRYANYGALKNLGHTLAQLKMLTPLDIMKEFDESSFKALTLPLLNQTEKIQVFETVLTRKDKSVYPVEVYLQLFDEASHPVFLAVVQDISERKKYEYQLIHAKHKAEESDKLKSIFLNNLSHEVRTPMNSIAGYTNLLMNRDLTFEKKEQYHEIVNQSINKILLIINNLVDLSKIESNQLPIYCELFDLKVLLKSIFDAFKNHELLINNSQITFELIDNSDFETFSINSDAARIKQVLDNLILNALKYTTTGNISFGFTVVNENSKWFAQLFVQDTGKGIDAEKMELVFVRFRQVEEEEYHDGSGLGLSISKGIVEILGGKIWVESEPDKGSTFYFTIPIT